MSWLIVGLGNPGDRYAQTPHNLGFDTADVLAARHRLSWKGARQCDALVTTGDIAGEAVSLMKPTTYMNLSGEAVEAYRRYFKIPASHVLVVSDDVALPWGRLRLREGGSHGGHNGLRNLIQHLETDKFPRIRIGCAPENWKGDLAAYVLAKLRGSAAELATHMTEIAADAVESTLARGIGKAQDRFNGYDALAGES